MSPTKPLVELLSQLKKLREDKGLTEADIEKRLILGPGWVGEFEAGKTIPSLDVFISVLNQLGVKIGELDFRNAENIEFIRNLQGTQNGADLIISFPYGKYKAEVTLPNAREEQLEDVLKTLRDGLAKVRGEDDAAMQIKADAVSETFLKAIQLWPGINPSDLWWFVVYRAFLDPYNHPATWAKLNLDQSWKRTGGWALEKIVVNHYGPALEKVGIKLFIAEKEAKRLLVQQVKSVNRIEADKADVLLSTQINGEEVLFGVVNVKASFAERRTDDVPLSRDLIRAGYYSPLWTMDCKGSPAARPFNKGELGKVIEGGIDKRSAKRKDIEDDGFFSTCFSYNSNTKPTPVNQRSKSKIVVCGFNDTADDFFNATVKARDDFVSKLN